MPIDKSSSSTEDQHDERSQSANALIDNQDIINDNLVAANENHDESSQPNALVTHEPPQTTTLDGNKYDNNSTPKLEAATNEQTKASATPLLDSISDSATTRTSPTNEKKSSPLDAQTSTTSDTSTTKVPDLDISKNATTISTHDSDANKPTAETSTDESQNLSTTKVNPTMVTETPTTQLPDLDASTQSTTKSVNDHLNSLSTSEHSTTKIPDSDATRDSLKSSTIMDPNSNQDSNSVNQTTQPTNNNDTKQATDQSTKTANTDPQTNQDNQGNPSPTVESSTSQILDSDDYKQATTVATDRSPKSSTIVVPTSNKDLNSVDQTKPSTADGDTPKSSTTVVPTSNQDPNSIDQNKPSTADGDTPKSSTTVVPTSNKDPNSIDRTKPSTADGDTPKSSTTVIPTSNQDPNSIDQTKPSTADGDTPKSSTTVVPTSNEDPNSVDHTKPSTADGNTPKSLTTVVPTSNQDPNLIDQAKASTANGDTLKSSTTVVPTSNQDQTSPPKEDNNTNQAANQSTKTTNTDPQTNQDNQGNPLPIVESSTSQIPDSDANMQATTVSTHNSPKSSTAMVPSSGQDPKLFDQTKPSETDSDSKNATNQTPSTEVTSKKDREQLENLIGQELDIVKKNCPRLGTHGQEIMEEAIKCTKWYEKLKTEPCELKDLKNLKKTVTKLKLQIPPRYMTYEESNKRKKDQSSDENSDNISTKLRKKMPRFHQDLFHKSSICNTIHLRFNALGHEQKVCLLCFSVFPENAEISRRSMIYWWIGEGLILGNDDVAEDRANEIFKELMDKDFIKRVSKINHRRYAAFCKMDPMVRAALVMIADKIRFFDFNEYGNPKDFGKFDEIESPEDMPVVYPLGEPREFFDFYNLKREDILEPIEFSDLYGNPVQFAYLPRDDTEVPINREGKTIDTTKKYYLYRKKKITTQSYKVCLMSSGLSKGIPWENLHLLFNVKDNILEFKEEWFLRMKNINVLFLGRWQSSATHHIEFEDFKFEKSFVYMNHVRFFSLQGVSRISKLPYSISKLKSLVILDLRACHNLEVIPETIGLLKCLTHLDISECYLLKKIPKEISDLESLQVLKGFVVVETPARGVCTLQDLKKLQNLRKLSMYTHMKKFPQESHLEALQKLDMLRKLTILWGGQQSKPEPNKLKQDSQESKLEPKIKQDVVENNKNQKLASTFRRLLTKKKWVEGSLRRMNAFNYSTFGSQLEKLDLKCYPHSKTPNDNNWLTPGNFQGLKKLYIRGGSFSDLGQYQEINEFDDSPALPKDTWKVEILRLKYLEELKMEWRELQELFPKLEYLEKVKCPRLTLFPCNEKGVWKSNNFGSKTT